MIPGELKRKKNLTTFEIINLKHQKLLLIATFFLVRWLNDPQFVGSFETEDHVYFLFREIAVEYINCGKVNKLIKCIHI